MFNVHSHTSGANWTQANGPALVKSPTCQRASAPSAVSSLICQHDSGARNRPYSDKADCWSAAVFLYEVLTGSTPFAHIHDRHALERAVLFSPISPPSYLSPLSRGFLTWALNRTPRLRPSVQEMLQHPWLHNGCFSASPATPQAGAGISAHSPDVWPASAPHAMVLPTSADAASEACLSSTTDEYSAEQQAGLKGAPGRRIVGFVPIVTAPSSSSSFSLQLTGDAVHGEAVQLSGMHRAIIDALRHRSPACSLTPRCQRSQQPSSRLLHEAVSTSTCVHSTGTASCSTEVPSQSQSSLQLCVSATPRPPPRVSSLTQALSLQRGTSLSDPPSPGRCSGRLQLPSDGLPSLSPLTYSSGQLAAAVRQPTHDSPLRRSPAVPPANVTVIYTCNDDVAQVEHQSESFGGEDGSRAHGASRPESRECLFAAAAAAAPPFPALTKSPGPPAHVALPLHFEQPVPLHPAAPDGVMNHVAASVFTDAAPEHPFAAAGADLDAVHHPSLRSAAPCGHQCSTCGGPGRDSGRCSDCQAAADLACIWQRAAGPSPIQRQLRGFERVPGQQADGEHDGPALDHPQAAQAADGVAAGCISAPAAPTQRSCGGKPPEKAEACPQVVSASVGSGISVEERRYEVRGSWGGSIDSTAGAMHAHLSKRVETAHVPDGFMVGGAQVRVASWVANAAAALWDSSSEDSVDGLDGMAFAGSCTSAVGACRPSELGSDESQAAPGLRASVCRDQGPASGAVEDRLKRGTPSLQVWEMRAALSSQGLDGLLPGPHTGPPAELSKWPNGAAKDGRRTAASSADVNSVVRTDACMAPDGSSTGGGSRPLLQSYGVDCSTVSLHAVAAALTPSMTGPSLLRSSPVYPEAHDE